MAALAVPAAPAAQERAKVLEVARVSIPPRIDGLIEDACWKARPPATGFFQHEPVNGVAASEETLVWASYDQDHLYFAFLMKDSEPRRIWAELTPRNAYENNDDITVVLDTYNDRRTSIEFSVNPRGVQKNTVETIWQSGAVIRADGWSAEIAIPFKSLRFSPEEVQVWGVNFERFIHRLSERDFWTDVDRDRPLLQQMGELRGLAGIRPGHNLEFFPYAGVRTSHWEGSEDSKVAAGLDVKYGFLPNVTLDLTASPDFSEVESDPFIYQLSPYENYLQENRPFFTEGSRYFRLATEQEEYYGGGEMNLFYSRRIENPRFAAKVSGKTGGYAFGVLGAVNRQDGPDRAFSVVRVQKDILANSQVGLYYTGVDERGAYNRVFAVDYSFNFSDIYYVSGASAFSLTSGGSSGRNGMHVLQFRREPDAGLQLSFGFQRIEPNLVVRTGFIDQVDIQTGALMVGHAWRLNTGRLRRISFDFTGEIEQDAGGDLTGQSMDFMVFSEFLSQLGLHGGVAVGRNRYQVRDGRGGLSWTRDFLPTREANLDFSWERGGFLKEISLEAGWEKRGVYNDDFTAVTPGSETALEGQLTLRPRSHIEWAFGGDWIRQTIDRTGAKVFDGVAYETSLHYQITTRLFVTTRLLGETREDQYNLDFLVGYYFGAGNIVQLSYKKSRRKEGFSHESGDSLTLKVSYLLRI